LAQRLNHRKAELDNAGKLARLRNPDYLHLLDWYRTMNTQRRRE